MALGATMYQFHVGLSDVDRGVYEQLELRVARHPSESMRYMLTRILAYCLSYQEGIAFSKGGLSSSDEPPVSVTARTGTRTHWIDVGAPSAERLHKAAKAVPEVSLFTHVELRLLRQEAESRTIHRVDEIEVWRLEPGFLDALEPRIARKTELELVRTEGQLYVTLAGAAFDGPVTREALVRAS
jgi:uncharacterized protein YaeQ